MDKKIPGPPKPKEPSKPAEKSAGKGSANNRVNDWGKFRDNYPFPSNNKYKDCNE